MAGHGRPLKQAGAAFGTFLIPLPEQKAVDMRPAQNHNQRILALFLAGALLFGLSACHGENAILEPSAEEDAVLLAMEEAIQDEYRAELIYLRVMEDFGPVLPFKNIVNAEVRHSEALASLYQARGLPVPQSKWTPQDIPSFPSVAAACQAGVVAEIENAEIYEGYMELPLPDDVRFVFERNMEASIERHLPAFERCS